MSFFHLTVSTKMNYNQFTPVEKNIADLEDGEEALIEVMATSNMSEVRIGRNKTILKLIVRDETSVLAAFAASANCFSSSA